MVDIQTKKVDHEPTNREILGAILDFSERVDKEFVAVRTELRKEMSEGITAVRKEMNEGITAVRKEMSEGITAVRKEMNEGFSSLRTEMNQGFTDIRNEIREIHTRLDKVEQRLEKLKKTAIEDSNAYGGDIVALQKEVKILKQKVLKLEAHHS